MSVMFVANDENPAQIVVCPKCGRKVRIDKECDCEGIYCAQEAKMSKKVNPTAPPQDHHTIRALASRA